VKRLYILMNCLLNMNTRAPGISIHKGAVPELFKSLLKKGSEILQVPCPEATFVGLKRWWFTKELYDSVPYREHCKRLARAVASVAHKKYVEGYRVVLVGLSLSPSCGVKYTQSDPSWEGKPYDVGLQPPAAEGKGVFIEELERALQKLGVEFEATEAPPSVIYPSYRVPDLGAYPKDYKGGVDFLLREMGLE